MATKLTGTETGKSAREKLNPWVDEIEVVQGRTTGMFEYNSEFTQFKEHIEYLFDQVLPAVDKELSSIGLSVKIFQDMYDDNKLKNQTHKLDNINELATLDDGFYEFNDNPTIPGLDYTINGSWSQVWSVSASDSKKLVLFTDKQVHFGQLKGGTDTWEEEDINIKERLERAGTDRFKDCATLKNNSFAKYDLVTTVTADQDTWQKWDEQHYKNVRVITEIHSDGTATACAKCYLRNLTDTDIPGIESANPGERLFGHNSIGMDFSESETPVGMVLSTSPLLVVYDPVQFVNAEGIWMRGFMDPSVDDQRIKNTTDFYKPGQYLVVTKDGTFNFNDGTSGGDSVLEEGDRIYFNGLSWAVVGKVGSTNKGWFYPDLAGGGATRTIVNGTNEYNQGDYLIAIHSGDYNFDLGVPVTAGTGVFVEVGDRIAYNGTEWILLTMGYEGNVGFLDPEVQDGGQVSGPCVDGGNFHENQYVVGLKDGNYNFQDGSPNNGTPIYKGRRYVYINDKWVPEDNSIKRDDVIQEIIKQSSHNFQKFNAVCVSDTGIWDLAETNIDKLAMGIVSEVIDQDTFVVTYSGLLEASNHGFDYGTYYLAETPGDLVPVMPQGLGVVVQKLGVVIDTNTLCVINDIISQGMTTRPIEIDPYEDGRRYLPMTFVSDLDGNTFVPKAEYVGLPGDTFPYTHNEELTWHDPLSTSSVYEFKDTFGVGKVGLKWDTGSHGWQMGAQNESVVYTRVPTYYAWYKGGSHDDGHGASGGGEFLSYVDSDTWMVHQGVRETTDLILTQREDRCLVPKRLANWATHRQLLINATYLLQGGPPHNASTGNHQVYLDETRILDGGFEYIIEIKYNFRRVNNTRRDFIMGYFVNGVHQGNTIDTIQHDPVWNFNPGTGYFFKKFYSVNDFSIRVQLIAVNLDQNNSTSAIGSGGIEFYISRYRPNFNS